MVDTSEDVQEWTEFRGVFEDCAHEYDLSEVVQDESLLEGGGQIQELPVLKPCLPQIGRGAQGHLWVTTSLTARPALGLGGLSR